jgi:hypothetical protein
MATATVPITSDKCPLTHVPPPTRTVYVLEERCRVHGATLMDHEYDDLKAALFHMRELIRWTPAAFRPDSPVRIVLTAVTR